VVEVVVIRLPLEAQAATVGSLAVVAVVAAQFKPDRLRASGATARTAQCSSWRSSREVMRC